MIWNRSSNVLCSQEGERTYFYRKLNTMQNNHDGTKVAISSAAKKEGKDLLASSEKTTQSNKMMNKSSNFKWPKGEGKNLLASSGT